jgi:hypothetical protein
MARLTFTLVSEGSSDRALLHPISWILRRKVSENTKVEGEWADLRFVRSKPTTLAEKIRIGLELYPCDLLFVHRDRDGNTVDSRREEISQAVLEACDGRQNPAYVCVIPIRMLEAWLLFDKSAIRRASGNPNGRINLDLPAINRVEQIADPKTRLHTYIRTASQATGRRLQRMNIGHCVYLISSYIADFSPLLPLLAFDALDRDIDEVIALLDP